MTALIVVACVILFFLLLGFVPVGVNVGYLGETFFLKVRVSVFRLNILPQKEKKSKVKEKPEKKPKKEKPEKPKKEKPSIFEGIRFKLDDIGVLLDILREALGGFRRGITVHLLHLDILCGGEDAADTAKLYGRLCAVMAGSLPGLYNMLRVKKRRVTVRYDFSALKTSAQGEVRITIRIGTAVIIGTKLLLALLRFYFAKKKESRNTKDMKLKEAV